MTFDEIVARVREVHPEAILEAVADGTHPHVRLEPRALGDVAATLKTDPDLAFEMLHSVSGVDWPKDEQLEVVYHLFSYSRRHGIAIKVRVPRDDPKVASLTSLWSAADWHERETYDLLGIVFTGHPHLRRILLPEDWVGHPLRKDYQMPVEYHGAPGLGSDLGRTE